MPGIPLSAVEGRNKKLGLAILNEINRVIVQMVVRIDSGIVGGNPVDTGRSRSNWIITLNNPTNSLITGEDQGDSGSPIGAELALSQANNTLKSRKPGDTIYLQNNTSYIEKLNNGSSDQAPANFVQKAIMEGIRSLKQAEVVGPACRKV
jgi:hypothetical protein